MDLHQEGTLWERMEQEIPVVVEVIHPGRQGPVGVQPVLGTGVEDDAIAIEVGGVPAIVTVVPAWKPLSVPVDESYVSVVVPPT